MDIYCIHTILLCNFAFGYKCVQNNRVKVLEDLLTNFPVGVYSWPLDQCVLETVSSQVSFTFM